jgi:hypothetical protein
MNFRLNSSYCSDLSINLVSILTIMPQNWKSMTIKVSSLSLIDPFISKMMAI